LNSLLEYRSCPNCGKDDFTVLFESNITDGDFQEGIETVYMLPGGKYGRHVRCRNCHLVYVNPIEGNGKINGDYSQRKSNDASIIRTSRLRAAKSQVQLIRKYGSGTNLLDVGCGEGFFLFDASKMGYIVRGVELSQDAAEYARREFSLDVEAKSFEEVEFPESYFDVVTLWQVLEHVPYPLIILKKVHRILKPGGVVAVATPNFGGILAKTLRKRWWNIRELHINQFTADTLKNMLGSAGFEDMDTVCYKEHISLPMLVIPILRYLKICERLEALICPNSEWGKITKVKSQNAKVKITNQKSKILLFSFLSLISFPYPSRLDNCNMIAVKPQNGDRNCNS